MKVFSYSSRSWEILILFNFWFGQKIATIKTASIYKTIISNLFTCVSALRSYPANNGLIQRDWTPGPFLSVIVITVLIVTVLFWEACVTEAQACAFHWRSHKKPWARARCVCLSLGVGGLWDLHWAVVTVLLAPSCHREQCDNFLKVRRGKWTHVKMGINQSPGKRRQ